VNRILSTAAVSALLLCGLAGCASGSRRGAEEQADPGAFVVPDGSAAFDAAREVLREMRFELERVDFERGVITTRPKSSAGSLTFWDHRPAGLEEELSDAMHRQERRVRVELPAGGAAGTGRVTVWIDRGVTPGARVSPRVPARLTYARDATAELRGVSGRYATVLTEDAATGRRIARAIASRVSLQAAGE
jgi:hypothetical protein